MADARYAPATEPGAIPVATPVPMPQTAYLEESMSASIMKTQSPVIAQVPIQQSATPYQNHAFAVANDPSLSRGPMMMRQCPHCHQESRTRVTTAPGWQTWAASVSKKW
jgi:hypothetical protein